MEVNQAMMSFSMNNVPSPAVAKKAGPKRAPLTLTLDSEDSDES